MVIQLILSLKNAIPQQPLKKRIAEASLLPLQANSITVKKLDAELVSEAWNKFGLSNPYGRNPANQLRLVVYPLFLQGLHIPGGCLGFLPSTVSMVFLNLILVGGSNPSGKYARQLGSFSQVGVNTKNI